MQYLVEDESMKKLFGILLGLLIVGAMGYIQATPIGGAKVTLIDEDGKALTDHGKVYYSVWTFDENGDIKVLQEGTLSKNFLFTNNIIKISTLDTPKSIARKIGSKTAFIGIDVWIVKDGKLYTFPPESIEVGINKNTFAENFELKFNFKEAKIKDLKALNLKTSKTEPLAHDVYYIWKTERQKSYANVRIPVLIIHNKAWSDVFATVDIAVQVHKYWGPDVTVAFGDQISKKVSFDPSSITVKVLGRSITDYYAGGDDITVPKEYSWGYVWIKGTVHYIYQKEYICTAWCYPTGNERYFAKIDSSIIDRYGIVKHIKSGATLGRPPYNFPSSWMRRSGGINGGVEDPVSISEFYGTIYAGTDGHSFGVGVPVGAILKYFAGGALPEWFDTLIVGFSESDYASYVMLGHLKNKGPQSTVTFYAMESSYKVRIPVHHWWGTIYEDVNVPVGLYVEVS
ncbi:hypothetical protein E3E31_01560 [Thermococcus sp. M39]|uniref:hypothetical protein n=1 Tax=unclassified Thermococcus TaxID=2627626 RepID=UPI00143A26B7|nr:MULTISPECIES: hypothetical protein [unclassified Thermococcus]NJE07241.1 hypothetical protein [Thermococcus sp. M39]NJE12627.1 hypothetical protein [Thermococcus sp. LS2]